jgi:hypothetical protein
VTTVGGIKVVKSTRAEVIPMSWNDLIAATYVDIGVEWGGSMDAWNSGSRGVGDGEQASASTEGLTRGVENDQSGWQRNMRSIKACMIGINGGERYRPRP